MARSKLLAIAVAVFAATVGFPASAGAAGLVAAYEHYEPGKGFEIGLVNANTGEALPVPAGVNTNADEVHPALSPDGHLLAFMRTTLLPQLDGDIVPPADRTLFVADRQEGTVTEQAQSSGGAGPVLREPPSLGLTLEWGLSDHSCSSQGGVPFNLLLGFATPASAGRASSCLPSPDEAPSGQKAETTQAQRGSVVLSTTAGGDHFGRYTAFAYIDQATGALKQGVVQFSESGTTPNRKRFGGSRAPTSHVAPREGDGFAAFDLGNSVDADIETILYPAETQFSPAPAGVNTGDLERMPAWSPDGVKLGFVRTSNGHRNLVVFDATPGIQGVVLAPVDLGADAPTRQTISYQSVWGGLSLANAGSSIPVLSCGAACVGGLVGNLSSTVLTPRVSVTTKGQTIGILVARVTGKRRLLGRTAPRIKVVGRVPLGSTRKGTNRFRWNGKVNGKRLKRGTYLLTYRALRRGRVVNTSGSIRFKVTRAGRITGARRQR